MTKKERIAALEAKVDDLQKSVTNLENMVASFMTTPHYGINYVTPSYPATPYDPNFWQPKVTC